MKDPDRLLAEVERLAELGDQAQSSESFSYVPANASELTRVELAQIAHHFRERFPFRSLRPRLAYESSLPKSKAILGEATLARMNLAEDPTQGGMVKARLTPTRTQAFYELHSEWVFTFITQEGVGLSRMRFPSVWDLELADSPPVEFDELSDDAPEPGGIVEILDDEPGRYQFENEWNRFDSNDYQRGIDLAFAAWADTNNPMSIPTKPRLDWYYEQDRLEFGESGRNGFARDVDHVAGFAPHRLAEKRSIQMDRPFGSYDFPPPASPDRNWVLKSLQLVSLLKHGRPQVYVSKQLPDMTSLGAEVRDLDRFEQMALRELYKGQDVHIEGRENQVRMLGSLRAIRQCLDCHSVDRGELLGAFTYVFVRGASRQPVNKDH
ncbi:MAG: hypothetical protein KDB00_18315 [Planctomycetales bacterium]|nr:hypothetical protein [Planctomycetales bacterium]